MKRVTTWSALLLVCSMLPTAAQSQERDHAHAGLGLVWAVPQGAFEESLGEDPAFGVTAFFGGRVPGSPLVLATELGILNNGMDQHLEVARYATIPLEALSVQSNSSVLMGHLVGRLQPPSGVFRPYVDALLGVRYFNTRTRIIGDFILGADDEFLFDEDGIHLIAHQGDFALSYGVGGGLDLDVYTDPMGFDERPVTISLNLSVRYLFGSEAEFVDEGSLGEEDGRILFDVERSRTDMLLPQIGLRINH